MAAKFVASDPFGSICRFTAKAAVYLCEVAADRTQWDCDKLILLSERPQASARFSEAICGHQQVDDLFSPSSIGDVPTSRLPPKVAK